MKLTESKLRRIIREEIKNITEAANVDMSYALKRIKEFNRGAISWDKMVGMIIDDLGYSSQNQRIRRAVSDHLGSSSSVDDQVPVDIDIIRELYDIIQRVA